MGNFWSNIIIFLLSVLFLGISIYSFRNNQMFNGVLSFLALITILVLVWKGSSLFERKVIPKNIVIDKYVQLMENSYKISLNPNYMLWKDDEAGENYVMILKDVEGDGMIRYFPFECNKYKLEFGRGTGIIKYRVAEVNNWLLKNSKLDLKPLIYADLMEKSRLNNIQNMQPQGARYDNQDYEEQN